MHPAERREDELRRPADVILEAAWMDASALRESLLREAEAESDQILRRAEEDAARLRDGAERLYREAAQLHHEAEQARTDADDHARRSLDAAPKASGEETETNAASTDSTFRWPVRKVAGAVGLALLVFFAALGIRAAVASPFTITQSSMAPTLEQGDRVLVNKLAYTFRGPKRGDVVVIDDDALADQALVKRIVGLPGNVVESTDGRLRIDGRAASEDYLSPGVGTPPFPAVSVDDGHVFVLGDNRSLSIDSRAFGQVPIDDVVGRVEAVLWPPSNIRAV